MVGEKRRAWRLPFVTRPALFRLALLGLVLAGLGFWGWSCMIRMPGESFRGPLPPLDEEEAALRDALRRDVEKIAGEIGERNLHRHGALAEAADWIEASLAAAGYQVGRQTFEMDELPCWNLDAEIPGSGDRAGEIVIAGAHYDSVRYCPGANDNGTGVAALLSLARAFRGKSGARTLRFVAFVNEEPPYFQTETMGSRVYARRCRERGEEIAAMISLETIGFYSDAAGSQKYPLPFGLFYPSTGDFIAFVGNVSSADLVRQAVGSFRRHARFPSEGGAVPGVIPGVGWSDHWSFWKEGYPALMVTDTAPFRYPHYHEATDTPEKIDYDRMARVVKGVEKVIEELVNPP